jgi:hypothetical protein
MIRPWVCADLDVMGALVVAAIDQQPPKAGVAHFTELDFLLVWAGESGHGPIKIAPWRSANSATDWASSAFGPLLVAGVDKCLGS